MTHRELDLGMSLFLELIQTDAQLAADAVDARREYFQGADGFAGDPRGAPSAEVRFLEWLLFERDHDGGLLVEELMPAWREMAPEAFVGREEVFLETTVGLFEVGDSAGEGLHWLRDVAGLGEYAVDLRMPSELIAAGDMIVGRVFPMGDSSHTLSPGGGCFRDETLLSAVQVDLDKARAQGDRKALRMRQVDLELMFWGKEGESRELDPVRDMRAFLEAGGLGSDEIDGLVEALAEKPLPDDDTGPLLASCLGELLDTMAFETDIDLSGAQEKILACWFYLQTAPAADLMHEQGQPAGELERMDPTDALSVFDADRRAGLDAETAISRLSANLGVDLDLDDELEESDPRPATALVHGLFAEYLWDVGRTEGEAVVAQRSGLQTSLEGLEDVEVLEELSARRLLLLGCTRLVEERGLSILDRGEAALTLGLFSAWCSEHHGMTPDSEVTAAFEGLPEAMDRISRANETLQSDALGGEWKELVPCDGRLVVQAEDGEAYPLGAAEECTGLLRSGDYVRGEFGGGSFHVSWCYPPELQLAR